MSAFFTDKEIQEAYSQFIKADAQWKEDHAKAIVRYPDYLALSAMVRNLRENRNGRSLVELANEITKRFDVSPLYFFNLLIDEPRDIISDEEPDNGGE